MPTVKIFRARYAIFRPICPYLCTYINMLLNRFVYSYVCTHTKMHACMHTYKSVPLCAVTCALACAHTCMYLYMHTYIRTYMRTDIHAYIHPSMSRKTRKQVVDGELLRVFARHDLQDVGTWHPNVSKAEPLQHSMGCCWGLSSNAPGFVF